MVLAYRPGPNRGEPHAMDTGFLLVAAIILAIVGRLGNQVAEEYFANVAIAEDSGVSAKDKPIYDGTSAEDEAAILPVLIDAQPSQAATPASDASNVAQV